MSLPVYSQPVGSVTGKVMDQASGDPIIGVTVVVTGTSLYSVTDINGNYMLVNVPAGNYKIRFQMMGYATSEVNVNVKPGRNPLNIAMSYRVAKTTVVTARRLTNTEASLLSIRKKASTAQDAISSEQIAKSPDSDAADAAKRVTGVTIYGGKFIYVRGLDERYSNILVNGAQVPSPLPNKRVIPLDIFPTGIIDNLIVTKTHSPMIPGDFGGGVITVNTKDFPDEASLKVGFSAGYNSNTTFKDFYTFDGSRLDYLGFNSGVYGLPDKIVSSKYPIVPYSIITQKGYSIDERKAFLKEFSDVYSIEKKKAAPSGKVSFSYGNTYYIDKDKGRKLGLLLSLDQKVGFSTREGAYKQFATSVPEANYRYKESNMSTNTTAQLVSAYSFNKHNDLKLASFYTHFSDKTAREKRGQLGASTLGYSDILKIVYTDLFFNQLFGKHYLEGIDSQVEWFGTVSWAGRNQPDTRVNKRNSDNFIFVKESLERYFNSFDELAWEFSPSITVPFSQWSGLKSKTTWGFDYSGKSRSNESRRFQYDINDADVDSVNNTSGFDTLYSGGY